jgi:hypothetical protein
MHASLMEAISLTISKSTPTPFSLTIMSQQGLRALPNPRVTFGSCFVDFFLVNSSCATSKIHASPLEGVSVMIFQSPPTPFSLTFS